MDVALNAISICIHYWIKEENRVKLRMYLDRFIQKIALSIKFQVIYQQMFEQYDYGNYDIVLQKRKELVTIASELVSMKTITLCICCEENFMVFDEFELGNNNNFDHKLVSYCHCCKVSLLQYF